jgi:SAM-dependent methyltransferase
MVSRVSLYGPDARLYDRLYLDEEYYRRSASFVLERLPKSPTILDLCAGTGTHAREFLAGGASVVAVDRSPQMLAAACAKAPGARVVCADVRRLALGERFDAVVCLYGAIHYLETRADVRRVLAVARKHLVPAGIAVFELRDHARLSRETVQWKRGSLNVSALWRPEEGIRGSDLYVVSAFDSDTGAHFVDVHHLFQTNPRLIAAWAEEAGLTEVELRSGYGDVPYAPGVGGDAPVLVARRLC